MSYQVDAVVVGAGPNGLAAAIELARAGRSVRVFEAESTVGGGCRTAELTLPGFRHDLCSAIHPLAAASPFFRSLPLRDLGIQWVHPRVPLAHPLDDGTCAVLLNGIEATSAGLDGDGPAYRALMEPMLEAGHDLANTLLGPLHLPTHPVRLARFGISGARSASRIVQRHFQTNKARALFAGVAAHSMLPLERAPTAAFAFFLMILAHLVGWPVVRGGSQSIADGLEAHFLSLGGAIDVDQSVRSIDELPRARVYVLDVTPRQVVEIAGSHLPGRYTSKLERYRYGPGVFKMDWALDGPIPWTAGECLDAGTIHVGGSFPEIATAEAAVWAGRHPERPFVLVAQQSLFDPTRAPSGQHTAWAYCHVPNGSSFDMSERIESQIERFAPGFGERILARSVTPPAEIERRNQNDIGGDISAGTQDLRQLLARPVARISPYTTPNPRILLCSASTPPGPGVHGMCGWHAARAALKRSLR